MIQNKVFLTNRGISVIDSRAGEAPGVEICVFADFPPSLRKPSVLIRFHISGAFFERGGALGLGLAWVRTPLRNVWKKYTNA